MSLSPTWANLSPTWVSLLPSWANLSPTWVNLLRRGPGALRRGGALRLAHHLDPLLQQLIAARDHSGEGAAGRDGGPDPHSVVGRAILLPDIHAGPAQRVTAGHRGQVGAAVGAPGGPAHEGAEPF